MRRRRPIGEVSETPISSGISHVIFNMAPNVGQMSKDQHFTSQKTTIN